MFLTITIIAFTLFISYRGMNNPILFEQFTFNIQKIRQRKEYYRFLTSAFLHEQWTPLIINMIVLFSLGTGIEVSLGKFPFILIFLSGIIGGNVLTLLLHQNRSFFNTCGAGGAVNALVFASITIMPNITFFMVPGWVFGVLYVLLTAFAIRSQKTDAGHANHLGGALMGMIIASLLFPQALKENWVYLLCVLLPALGLIWMLVRKPNLILSDKKLQHEQLNFEDRYNLTKVAQKKEVDRILEKIHQQGMESLTPKERNALDEYSRS